MNRTLVNPDCLGLVRAATPEDAAGIRDFICGLSEQSQYLRFFASVAPPSAGLLRALTGGTGADVLIVTDSAGRVLAHAMAADVTCGGEPAANIGLVVADGWQRRGLGALLLTTLVSRAAERGARLLVLDVLPGNRRMLGIIERRWPTAPQQRTRDALVITPRLTPQHATGALRLPAFISLSPNPEVIRAAARTAA
jgi:GNAT superfamily N-acetyltransferase